MEAAEPSAAPGGPSKAPGPPPSGAPRGEQPEPDRLSVGSNRSKNPPPDLRGGAGPPHTGGGAGGLCGGLSSAGLDQDVPEDPIADPPSPQSGIGPRRAAEADAGLQKLLDQVPDQVPDQVLDQDQVLDEHRDLLRDRCKWVEEGTDAAGSGALLNQVYTELYITEGPDEEVRTQHEVRLLEASRSPQDAPIRVQDIFKPPPGRPPPRLVLTVGVAGVGKTFSVLKFCLDWAQGLENRAQGLENRDLGVVVLLSFRELNLLRGEQHSLLGLLALVHPALKRLRGGLLALVHPALKRLRGGLLTACRPLLILDGLDESRLDLD